MASQVEYAVHVVGPPLAGSELVNGNVDVEVHFVDGRRFGATFFTVDNLRHLFDKNRRTGECAGGLYLWAVAMIVAEDLSAETMARTVADLLERDEFEAAFVELPPLPGEGGP